MRGTKLRPDGQNHSRSQADLEQVTSQEWNETNSECQRRVSAQQRQLGNATDVDQHHAGSTGKENPNDRLRRAPNQSAGDGSRDRKCEQVSTGRSNEMQRTRAAAGKHWKAERSEDQVEHERAESLRGTEKATDHQDRERLQRHGNRTQWHRDRELRRDRDDEGSDYHWSRPAGDPESAGGSRCGFDGCGTEVRIH